MDTVTTLTANQRQPALRWRGAVAGVVAAGLLLAWWLGLHAAIRPAHPALATLPSRLLWAWERPEDLRWLPGDVGVAYVASAIELHDDVAAVRLRANPLYVRDETARVPVVHVDASVRRPPTLTVGQQQVIVEALLRATRDANRHVVQLDFEVRRSQRDFLRQVIGAARRALPADMALSVTALASWCQGDRWMQGLAANEIVPMAFRMASGDREIRRQLHATGRFRAPECEAAVGMATDEAPVRVMATRRYYFSPKPWTMAIWQQQRQMEEYDAMHDLD